jgi:predicted nucleic acid-binding protein
VKVLVDTSAWVDFFNGFPSREHAALAKLIAGREEICTCGIVVSEVFQGLRREKGRGEIERRFREMVFLEPSGIGSYLRAAEIFRDLRRRGITVRSTINCILAAIAEENDCEILARDRDMESILGSGLVKAGLWPAGEA